MSDYSDQLFTNIKSKVNQRILEGHVHIFNFTKEMHEQIHIFCIMMACSLVGGYQIFEETLLQEYNVEAVCSSECLHPPTRPEDHNTILHPRPNIKSHNLPKKLLYGLKISDIPNVRIYIELR
jgi:hypothetical protein